MSKTQTKAFLDTRPVPMPDSAEVKVVPIPIDFAASAYSSGDLIELVKLPIGVRCVDWALNFPDIDSGGSPAIAFSLGIENTGGTDIGTEVWASGLTAAQTGGVVRNTTGACATGDTTVDRNVVLKVTTAAATYAGAGQRAHLLLSLVG